MIQSNKYIIKTSVCPKCWKAVEWTPNEEQRNYLGRPIVRCPECGEIIQANMNQILGTVENDGTPPISITTEEEEMITITFDNSQGNNINHIVTRQYPKGKNIILPTYQELFGNIVGYDIFKGWNESPSDYYNTTYPILINQSPPSEYYFNPVVFNEDITLYPSFDQQQI